MGVRKNAKFLTASEREAFVRACVMMKADIVNPGDPDPYSRWDQYVAIHRFIQNVTTPATPNVNFGHGGTGAHGFLSWHRYFLFQLEQQLQSYVGGVMLPHWDWTDPVGTIVVEDFLGPSGDPASSNQVRLGYFATEAPGTGANTTPAPPWWPVDLSGWNLHSAFGVWAGALRRNIQPPAGLPSILTLRSALDMGTYPAFQNALESGSGTCRSILSTMDFMAGSAAAATWEASRSPRSIRCSTFITAIAIAFGRCGRWTGTPTNIRSPVAIPNITATIRCIRG